MTFYVILGTLLAFFTLLLLWLIIKTNIHVIWKVSTFTFLVGICLYTSFGIKEVLGYPTFDDLVDGTEVVGIYFTPMKDHIYLWCLLPNDTVPRNYEVTYNKKLKEQLQDAQDEAARKKGKIILHFGKKGGKILNGKNENPDNSSNASNQTNQGGKVNGVSVDDNSTFSVEVKSTLPKK